MSRKTAGLGFGLAPRLAQLSRQRLSRPQDGSLYYKPEPKRREFPRRAAALPDFSATRQGGRSILLDEMNPIQEPRAYIRGKKGEPRPRHDPRFTQRAMTKDERKSWSNPYLRMLSSAIRRCTLTSRYLPMDLLVRLSLQRVPLAAAPAGDANEKTKKRITDGQGNLVAILPDNDPDNIVNGRGFYIVCSRSLFDRIPFKGLEYGLDKRHEMHPDLTNYIGALLRGRILQCLDVLEPRLRAAPHSVEQASLVRRLTWTEWNAARDSGVLPSSDAQALILFREPSKRRAADRASAEKLVTVDPPQPPPHVFFQVEGKGQHSVPLYDASTYFSDGEQRAALRKKLNALLNVERIARRRANAKSPEQLAAEKVQRLSSEEKPDDGDDSEDAKDGRDKEAAPSDAYLVCSSASTLLRADAVPTLIALWRLRMWEDVHGDIDVNDFGWEVQGTCLSS